MVYLPVSFNFFNWFYLIEGLHHIARSVVHVQILLPELVDQQYHLNSDYT
jgi:hypothetical protein